MTSNVTKKRAIACPPTSTAGPRGSTHVPVMTMKHVVIAGKK